MHRLPRARARRRPHALVMATGTVATYLVFSQVVGLGVGLASAGLPSRAEAGMLPRWREIAAAPAPLPAAAQLSRRADGGVELAIEPAPDGSWEVWVDNPLFGPVEALVLSAGSVQGAEPGLPARVRVPAQRRVLASRLPAAAGAPRLQLRAVAGDPGARPDDADYRFPLDSDRADISQGWGGHFSHRDLEHRHALDLSAAEGTPVLAARAGVVMQVVIEARGRQDEAAVGSDGRRSPPGGGLRRETAAGNAIRVLHEDGSMALYAHLAETGLHVRPGQRVRRGEAIARVGNTGNSTGPHLHFAVQVNRGLRLETLPFRMSGPQGVLRLQEAP